MPTGQPANARYIAENQRASMMDKLRELLSMLTKPERWFYLDGFEANEFCPLWRYVDRFSIWMNPPANSSE